MTFQEIVDLEAQNDGVIRLYFDGVFWKAYQQSAYLFARNVMAFKLTRKFVKPANMEVVSLRFSRQSLEKLFNKKQIVEVAVNQLSVFGYSSGLENYQQWLEATPLKRKKREPVKVPTQENISSEEVPLSFAEKERYVIEQLCNFRIEKSTPMDCMTFIVFLQKILDGHQ